MVNINLITNCLATTNDANVDNKIYLPNVHYLKVEVTGRRMTHVKTNYIHVPPENLDIYQGITLATEIIFIKRM